MTRERGNDTEPQVPAVDATRPGSRPLDKTDPGFPPGPVREEDAPPLTTEADMLKAEQLIGAFKRPPRRPTPAYTERAQSEGGNAVGYRTTARAAQGLRPVEEREKVLVQLAELARGGAPLRVDVPTGPSEEKRQRRRSTYFGIGALVSASALAILIPVALRTRSEGPALKAAASAAPATALPLAVSVLATSSTPELPATLSASSPAGPEATSATARPTGGKPEPHRERHHEPQMAPSASRAAKTPLKDQFWE